ncbi:MAG: hypothetical protein ABIA04_10150 [Pseudomonadota bacterium]
MVTKPEVREEKKSKQKEAFSLGYTKEFLINKAMLEEQIGKLKKEYLVLEEMLVSDVAYSRSDFQEIGLLVKDLQNRIDHLTKISELLEGSLRKNYLEPRTLLSLLTQSSKVIYDDSFVELAKKFRLNIENKDSATVSRKMIVEDDYFAFSEKMQADLFKLRSIYGTNNYQEFIRYFNDKKINELLPILPSDIIIMYGISLSKNGSSEEAYKWLKNSTYSTNYNLNSVLIYYYLVYLSLESDDRRKINTNFKDMMKLQNYNIKITNDIIDKLHKNTQISESDISDYKAAMKLSEAEIAAISGKDLLSSALACYEIIDDYPSSAYSQKAKSILEKINPLLTNEINNEIKELNSIKDIKHRISKAKDLADKYAYIWPSKALENQVQSIIEKGKSVKDVQVSSDEAYELIEEASMKIDNFKNMDELINVRNRVELLIGTDFESDAKNIMFKLDDKITKDIRTSAAKRFLASERITDAKKKLKELIEIYYLINEAIAKYTYSPIIDKLKDNRRYVLKEIRKIDPDFN